LQAAELSALRWMNCWPVGLLIAIKETLVLSERIMRKPQSALAQTLQVLST